MYAQSAIAACWDAGEGAASCGRAQRKFLFLRGVGDSTRYNKSVRDFLVLRECGEEKELGGLFFSG